MKRTSHSYYAVFIDFGRRGLEAIVQPEITRREVVARIKSGEYRDIAFIHWIADGLVEDVTSELIDAAELELKEEYLATKHELFLQRLDHVRDLRKHEVA